MTIKQRSFIQKYLKYGNATRAAMDIYNTKNRNSAGVIGWNLLRNVKVRTEINRIIEAEESLPMSIAITLKQMLEFGSWKEKTIALKMAMKIHGY